MVARAALKLGSELVKRRKPLRDSLGRFASTESLMAEGAALSYMSQGGHSRCGKKQYKSKECKARSIRKNAIERGEATAAEGPYIRWLRELGE